MSELNTTMRDAMWRGHGGWEIALTPALLGFFGWLLDGQLGTTPLFIIVGVLVGLFGAIANQYYRYRDQMEAATVERQRLHAASHVATSSSPFSPIEQVDLPTYVLATEVDTALDNIAPETTAQVGQ